MAKLLERAPWVDVIAANPRRGDAAGRRPPARPLRYRRILEALRTEEGQKKPPQEAEPTKTKGRMCGCLG